MNFPNASIDICCKLVGRPSRQQCIKKILAKADVGCTRANDRYHMLKISANQHQGKINIISPSFNQLHSLNWQQVDNPSILLMTHCYCRFCIYFCLITGFKHKFYLKLNFQLINAYLAQSTFLPTMCLSFSDYLSTCGLARTKGSENILFWSCHLLYRLRLFTFCGASLEDTWKLVRTLTLKTTKSWSKRNPSTQA